MIYRLRFNGLQTNLNKIKSNAVQGMMQTNVRKYSYIITKHSVHTFFFNMLVYIYIFVLNLSQVFMFDLQNHKTNYELLPIEVTCI